MRSEIGNSLRKFTQLMVSFQSFHSSGSRLIYSLNSLGHLINPIVQLGCLELTRPNSRVGSTLTRLDPIWIRWGF